MIAAKAAFVLRLTDDYSGKAITGKAFVFRREGRLVRPVKKEEGLYVFLEPMEKREEIEISGPDYYPHTAVIEKEKLRNSGLMMNVRLYGRPGGNFPYHPALAEGRLEQGQGPFPAEVCVKRMKKTGLTLKAIKEAKGAQYLVVHGFTREQLTGKTCVLYSGQKTEVFVLAEKTGLNEYKIEGRITGDYPEQTPVERAYRSVTDEKGAYSIPVEPGEQQDLSDVIVLL